MLLVLVGCLLVLCYGQGPPAVPDAGVQTFGAFYDSIFPYGAESEECMDTSGVHIDRISDTTAVVNGLMILNEVLPEKSILVIVVYKVLSSGKEEVYQTLTICDLCAELANPDSTYRDKLDKFGLPPGCPINPGSYNITGMCFDADELVPLCGQTIGRYVVELVFCYATGENCQKDRVCTYYLRVQMTVEDTT